jgi:osmoprotectant transport system substrate-binding protein
MQFHRLGSRFVLTLLLVVAVALVGCEAQQLENAATDDTPTIRVASKDFTESFILGEMYALMLEDAGFPVERRINLGGTPVVQQALLNNEVDLYPEYTGTGLLTVLKLDVMTDPQEVYDTVKAAYEEQFDLTWLDAAPMNNTQALAMTRTRADELAIATLSDLAGQAESLVLASPPEFTEREDGLPGLQSVYGGFNFQEVLPVDPGLRYQALMNGEADVVVAFGTDGEIAANDLVLLEDDQGLWPPYQVAPVVRQELADNNPGIADALNRLAPVLTDEIMQQLNYEVSGNQREPADVAREFLLNEGLIEADS